MFVVVRFVCITCNIKDLICLVGGGKVNGTWGSAGDPSAVGLWPVW